MNALRLDKRFRTDFSWVLAGNVLYSACQWGAVVALAKLGSPAAVGEYALGMAVTAPVILLGSFQLRALLASDVKGEFSFGEYLGFRLCTLGLALLAIAGLTLGSVKNANHGLVILLVGVAIALDHWSDTYYGFMQKHERMDRISTSLMLKGPLSLALLSVAMYVTRNVAWAVSGMIAGRVLMLLVWDSRLGFAGDRERIEDTRLRWNIRKMLGLLKAALPLGAISMLLSLNSNIPRYFLEAHGGTTTLGIYSAIASLLTAGSLVVSAYGQSIFMPVAQACAANDPVKFRNSALLAGVLGLFLGLAAVLISTLFGHMILARLFRSEYAEHTELLIGLMMAGTVWFVANGLGFVMTAARRLSPQIPLLIATLLTSAAVSAWAIPRFGLFGAVYATFAAAIVQTAGTLTILLRVYRGLQASAVMMTTEPDVNASESVEVGI